MDWSDLSFKNDPLTTKENMEDIKKIRESIDTVLKIAKKNKLLHIPEIIFLDDDSYADHGISDLPQ